MISSNGSWIATSVRYARSVEELKAIAARYEYFSRHPFMIQEYISGQAEGVFVLCDHGKPIVFFAHRRLRERPPTGGVSVLSESIEPNPEAQRIARTILEHVGWHGVAMVEFKVSAEGTPYLMEVNGRFWGSLQLAIDAGADFPWLLYQSAIGTDLDKVKPYSTGVKCRWLLGDLVSLWKVLISNGSGPHPLPFGKVQSILQFLNFFEESFARFIGVRHALAVSSCTAALHLSLDAAGLSEGDEVLIPTLTFAATGEVVTYLKAKPVLVDVDPVHFNLNVEDARRKITAKTKAVIPVHFGGHPCPMDAIGEFAVAYSLTVIEDAAHAIPATFRG